MAKIPVAQEQVVFSPARAALPQVSTGGENPLTQALSTWSAQRKQQRTEEALQRVQATAISEQLQVNTTGIVQPPPDTTGIFAETYVDTAKTVFGARVKLEGQQVLNRLAREHPTDPNAMALKYNEWMAGKIQAVREVDAVGAFELQMELEQGGIRTMFDLQDAAAAAAREVEAAEADDTIMQTFAAYQDRVRQSGSEIALAEARTTFDVEVDRLRAARLISLDRARALKLDAARTLTREMYFGQFEQLVDAGNVPAAQALIEHAASGLLFDDNDDGRILADQLATDLRQRLASSQPKIEGQMAAARSVVSDGLALQRSTGRAPSSAMFQQSVLLLANSENVNDRLAAEQALATLELGDLAPQINGMNLEQLEALPERASALVGTLSGEALTAMATMAEERRLQILDARRRDPMQLMDDPAAGEPQAGFDWWAGRRTDVARITGMGLDEIPVYSEAKAQSTAEMFGEALARERPDEALQVLLDYLPPDRVAPHDMAAVAMQHNIPEIGAAGTLLAAAGPETMQVMLALRAAGGRLSEGERVEAFDLGRKKPGGWFASTLDDRIMEVADTLSMGSTAIRERIRNDLRLTLAGLWANEQRSDSDEAEAARRSPEDQMNDLLESFEQRQTLANGRRVPAGIFGAETVAEINRVLGDDAQAFFGDSADRAMFIESLVPVPGPQGSVYFRSTIIPGQFIGDESRKPYKLSTVEPTPEEQARTGFNTRGEMLVSRGLLPGGKLHSLQRTIPLVAEAAGADSKMLRSLFLAAQNLPQKQVSADHNFTMGFAESNLDLVDDGKYRRAWFDIANRAPGGRTVTGQDALAAPDPWDSPDGAALAAALILGELEQEFSDPRQILLAYTIGADRVREAGDNWPTLMTTPAAAYLGTVIKAVQQ